MKNPATAFRRPFPLLCLMALVLAIRQSKGNGLRKAVAGFFIVC